LKRIHSTFLTILLVVGFLVCGGYAKAQTSLGTLVGTARDKSGAVISHANVTITNQATGQTRTGTTGGDGAYRFDAVPPGPYTINFEAAGFENYKAKDVQITASTVTSYDLAAVVGSRQDIVTVEADQATINTENGQLAGVVGEEALEKLPIFSLNPIELALTVPGVQPVANGVGALENGVNIQVNGARPRSNNFLLDGQEINDVSITGQAFQPAIPDMFESVTVITSSASAEYGRGGGGIVNTTTKSGTNTFHGSVFERYTGSGLNSIPGGFRGPTDQTGFLKARSDEHSYGFTGGGAILKNKLFVYGADEYQRVYGTEQPGVNLLPDAAGYATLQTITGSGATQVQLLDQYLSNGAYLKQDGTLPALPGTIIKKNVGALPGCAPAGGCVITFAGFQRPNQALQNPDTQWSYRVDYKPWEKDSTFFRYLHDRTSLTPDFFNNPNALIGFDTQQGGPSELGEGGWTHIFSPALLNEFRVSEARIAFTFAPTAATLANPLNDLPTLNFANTSGATVAGTFSFPALGPDQNFPQGREEDLYQFQDTVTFTKGRQTMRMGADIGRLIEIDLVSQNAKGALTFEDGGNATTAFGNFLINQLGASGSATKVFGPTRADSHGYRNGVFFQDDIKINADLTLNLGMRWDYLSNPENSLKYPGVDPANPLAPIPTFVPIRNDWTNISPRVGFAYSPHGKFGFLGDGKTVLRGGFGVFYDSTFSNILVNSAQAAPESASGLIQQVKTASPGPATGLIATISPVVNQQSLVESEASDLENPITYQYNVGVERELPGAITLTARYVGNQGRKLFANQQYNSPINGFRPDADRGEIVLRGNYGRSNYNGLEVSGTHNFQHGLFVSTNYTYSKDLSTADDIFSGVGAPSSYGINLAPGFRKLEYGNSAFDHRQFFSVAYAYSPQGLHSSNAFANSALGALTRHWTISGVTQLQSGGYTSLNINGIDTNGDLNGANDRPLVSNRSLPLTSVGIDGSYFGGAAGTLYDLSQVNTNPPNVPPATVTPAQVHFIVQPSTSGNPATLAQTIGRNSFLTPGTTTNNIALEKGIGLSYFHLERGALTLRAEAQNVFNHNDSQTTDPNPLDAGAGFLTPSRVESSRTLILWAKIKF